MDRPRLQARGRLPIGGDVGDLLAVDLGEEHRHARPAAQGRDQGAVRRDVADQHAPDLVGQAVGAAELGRDRLDLEAQPVLHVPAGVAGLGLLLAGLGRAQLHVDLEPPHLLPGLPGHLEGDRLAGLVAPDLRLQVRHRLDPVSVHREHHVAALDARLACRAAALRQAGEVLDLHAADLLQAQVLGQRRVHRGDADPQHGTPDLAVAHQVLHHLADQLRGHGEAVALVRAGLAQDGRAHPHDLAPGVHQGTAGVAAVDDGVGLDEVLDGQVGLLGEDVDAAPLGADDARGDRGAKHLGPAGALEAGAPHGQHPLAHP